MASLLLGFSKTEVTALTRLRSDRLFANIPIVRPRVRAGDLDPERPAKIKAQVAEFVERFSVTRIYAYGLCGALDPELQPGDVVFSEWACHFPDAKTPDRMYGGVSLTGEEAKCLKEATASLAHLGLKKFGSRYDKILPTFYRGASGTADWFPTPEQYLAMSRNRPELPDDVNKPDPVKWVVEQDDFHLFEIAAELGIEYYPFRVITDVLRASELRQELRKALAGKLRKEPQDLRVTDLLSAVWKDSTTPLRVFAETCNECDLENAVKELELSALTRYLYDSVKMHIANHRIDVLRALLGLHHRENQA